MSILKEKSEENFQAVGLLSASKLYTPGIHCAYYSSFQLIIHYFHEISSKSYDEVASETSLKGTGVHAYYLSEFVKEISVLNQKNATLFYKYFNQFKRKRNNADYKPVPIGVDDLEGATMDAKNIRAFLKMTCDEGKCEDIYSF